AEKITGGAIIFNHQDFLHGHLLFGCRAPDGQESWLRAGIRASFRIVRGLAAEAGWKAGSSRAKARLRTKVRPTMYKLQKPAGKPARKQDCLPTLGCHDGLRGGFLAPARPTNSFLERASSSFKTV